MNDLDSGRREAIRLLCQAQATDQLSVEAFESRLEQVKQAPNQATLAAILADLVPDVPVRYAAAIDHTGVAFPVSPAEYVRVTSVFASTKRVGSWTVPLHIDAKILFGELTLDLRDAVFGADVVDITVDVKLGSFSLIVPAGTQVENEVEETFTGSEHSTRTAPSAQPNGLLVRLHGRAFMASIEVKEKLPSNQAKGTGILNRLLGSGD